MTLAAYQLHEAFVSALLRLQMETPGISPEVRAARLHLRRTGWTQTEVAQRLGVERPHVCRVLNGHRESRRLIKAVLELPENPSPA